MRCPICKEALATTSINAVAAHTCTAGHGVLIAGADLTVLLEALARDPNTPYAAVGEVFGQRALAAQDLQRKCYACYVDLHPVNYAYNSNIFIERCPQCDRVWLDADELPKLVRYIKGNPKVDALGAGIAEKVRAQHLAENRPEAEEPALQLAVQCLQEMQDTENPWTIRLMWGGLLLLLLGIVFALVVWA